MSETKTSGDYTTIRRGSRVRHSDGVEGRITWVNAVAVKIEWADGEKVTWKRAELADKGLELLDEREAPQAASATPDEPTAPESAPRPAPEPFGPLDLGVPGAGGITETPPPVVPAAAPSSADSPVRIQTTAVEDGWVAEVFEPVTGTVVFTSSTHPEESGALAEARDWRPADGADEAVGPSTETPDAVTDPATETEAAHEAREAAPATPAKKRTKRTAAKQKAAKTERLSAIDAAARVLQEAGKAMNCAELIGVMAAKGYWSSPGGKTPAATLYSAILRELQTKGDAARFVKAARGQFAFRTQP